MIQLQTLGSIDLLTDDRPGASAVLLQPKRLALLTYLALTDGFVRRDTLLALFWPETDQLRGRNVLRQSILLLRRSLGLDAILSRGAEELRVNPAVVRCDVTEFQRALEDGRTQDALALYRGDFLKGFHVPDAAPELDEWIQSEARRLRALATQAAWSLAVARGKAGDSVEAAIWARRARGLDPHNEQLVADVMLLLVNTGDRPGALHEYREHARRMSDDLGLEPAQRLRTLADTLQSIEPVIVENRPPNAIPREDRTDALNAMPRARTRRYTTLLWSVPVLALVITAALFWRQYDVASGPVIAVEAIRNAGGDTLQEPASLSADLLSTSLARLAGLQVIPATRLYDVQSQLRAAGRAVSNTLEAARQAGAEQLIQGTLHEDQSGVRLDLQIVDARSGTVLNAYRAHGPTLFAAIDQATSQIASGYRVAAPRAGISQSTTSSLIAYRLYERGLRAHYEENDRGALPLFEAALAEDSTFALAAYYAAVATNSSNPAQSRAYFALAARHAARAPDRERLLILERVAAYAMSPTASAWADSMARRYPRDPQTQYALGAFALQRGEFDVAASHFRRVIDLDSLSLTRANRCLACDAYGGLYTAHLHADSTAAAERAAREFHRARPSVALPLLLLGNSLARQNRTAEALRIGAQLDSMLSGSFNRDLYAANLAIRVGDFRTADERLRRMIREGSGDLRDEAAWYLVISLRAQGRLREALAVTDQHKTHIARDIVLFELGRTSEAALALESRLSAPLDPPGPFAKHQTWLFTHIATALAATGDTTRLEMIADSLEKLGPQSGYGRDWRLHHYVRGLQWSARKQPERAAQAFRSSIWSWTEGYTRANYELAKTLLELRRPEEAVYPLQAALRGDIESSNLYITRTEIHELLARTFDELGQRDSAVAHYQHVVHAWHAADPKFVQRRNVAQARLTELLRAAPGRKRGSAVLANTALSPPHTYN